MSKKKEASHDDDNLDDFIEDIDNLLPQNPPKKPSISKPSNIEDEFFEEFIEEPLSDTDKPSPQITQVNPHFSE